MSAANSPYQPPTAPVSDPVRPAVGRPPWPVITAIICAAILAIRHVLLLVGVPHLFGFRQGMMRAMIVQSIFVVLIVLTAWMLARGRGWSLWLLLAVAALQTMGAIQIITFHLRRPAPAASWFDPIAFAIWLTPPFLAIAATVLAFGPGRAWFRGRS